MAIRNTFSDDEWFLLMSTPAMIGAAMANAGRSGPFGTVKEAVSSLSTVVAAGRDQPDNALIQALTKRGEDRESAKAEAEKYQEMASAKLRDKTPEQLTEEMLEDVRRVSQLLHDKASPEDALGYREWAMNIAETVAASAKEGSFLGFGGEQISPEEQALLARINAALSV